MSILLDAYTYIGRRAPRNVVVWQQALETRAPPRPRKLPRGKRLVVDKPGRLVRLDMTYNASKFNLKNSVIHL